MTWNLFARMSALRQRRSQRAFRPTIEALEARDLPSAAPLLQLSSNGRYLVAAGTNQPFYMIGDSPWEMSTNITEAEAQSYFNQRASQGFNTVIIQATNDVYTGAAEAHPPADTSGDLPFATLADGNFDLSKPNPVYWQHIQNLVTMAENDGIEVILFPAFYGTKIFADDYDWGTEFNDPANTANNNASIRAWGQYLGQTFVNDNNIIWAVGGDYNSLENSASDGQLGALLQGIQQYDTRHLTTMEGWDGYNSSAPRTAFDNTNLRQYMTLDGVYVSHTRPFSSLFQQEYNAGNSPTFLIESTYEDNGTNTGGTTLPDIRHEAYVDFLSGTTGYMFGNDLIWEFGTGWQQQMTSPGAQEMTYFGDLVNSLPWYNLTPDWNGTVFQGVSTSTDYVGEYAADGSLAIAYQPSTGTGSQSFTVNMSKFSGPVTAQWFDPTNGTYTTIGTGLANSGTMTFNSPSTNSGGQNDFVLILKATPATVPAAPAGLTATAGNAQVTLSWTASSGATSYNIYRSTTSGGEGSTPIATGVSGTSFINTGLTNGTTYFYKVAAVNSAGTSPLSSEASATPQVSVPPAPTGLTTTAGNADVSLTWTASSGATSYNIYRSTTSGGEGSTPIATGVSTTSYTDTGLTNGTTYYYEVAAVDAAGPGAKSAEASATPSAQVFMGEQSVLPSVDSNNGNWLIAQQATLSQAATLESLSVYVSQVGGQLLLGVYDASGPGGGPGKLLAAVNGFTPVVGWNTVNVVTPVTLAAGNYWLAFLPSSNTLGVPIASTGSAAWYQLTYGALPATFSTTPTDATANWSVYATLTLNTVSPPAAPTGLTATAGNAQVSLTWTASSGATSYNIYRSTTSGAETLLASGVSSTSYTDSSVSNGTTYYYKVAAVNAGGISPLSSEVSATPQVPAPAAPTNLIATAGNAQVSLTWTASSGAASYNIYRSTTSGAETLLASAVSSTSYSDSSVSNGTTYYYKVAAVNAGGTSPLSSEVSATPQVPAPAAPTNLTASAGNAQVSLTWTASSGATTYNVYRSTTSGAETLLASAVSSTSYADSSVTNGTTYYYKVAAVNAGGTSPLSSEVSATPQVAAPPAPTNLVATAGNAQVSLTWTASSGATSYNIYRATTSGTETLLQSGVSSTTFTDSSVTNGTTYYYKVAAVNAGGTSPLSSEVSATPQVAAPAAPTNLTATAGNAQVSLTWTTSSGATSYNIYRSTTSGAETLLASGVSSTSYTDSSVSNGTTYYYKVAALNAGGTSPLSSEVSATPQVPAPAAPTNLTATAGNAQVSLTWTASSGATSYNVYRSTSSGAETLLASAVSGTSYSDSSVTNGTTYYYKVAAVNAGGTSPLSSEVSATPGTTVTLTPIANAYTRDGSYATTNFGGATLLQLKDGGSGWDRYIFLQFNISTLTTVNSATLQLYGNIDGTSPTDLGVAVYGVAGNAWTENAITWNTQPAIGTTVLASNTITNSTPQWYSFNLTSYIQAAKASGATEVSMALEMTTYDTGGYVQFNSREASSNPPQLVITGGTVAAPAAPTNLTASAGNAQVSLSWTGSSGATSYNIYRSTSSGGEGSTPYLTGVTTTSFTDTGVSNGTTYYYEVTAVNSGGESGESKEASATPQVPAPAAPTGLTATAGNAQVSLSWTASSGATSYNIYRSITSGAESLLQSGVSGTTFTDSSVTNGTTYYYKVAAVNAGGTSPLSGEVSATPQVAAPAAPTNLVATAGNAQVSLTWTAASGAASYSIYRSTTSGSETLLASGVSSTSYTDSSVTNGTTYYYKVAAVNAGGTSPLSSEVSATPSAQVFMGEQNVLSSVDSNNANWLIAQQATLAQSATIQSLSVYVSQAGGQLLLGVYDASGPGGGPGKLLASASAFTPVVGWNTVNVGTPVSLAAGNYWLAFLPSSNSLDMPIASTGSAAWYQYSYGPLPTTFSTAPTDATAHWSVYATLNLQAAGTLVTAISAGGPAAGAFAADTDFSGGTVSGGTTATINTSQVSNPAPMSVYQHGRYGNMTYTIANLTPGATYTVQLDFVEYYWNAPGQRVFNVAINGTQVLSNFDIFAAAGGKDIAIARSFTATASSSGTITIAFTSLVDNAMIDGIEIYSS